MFKIFFNADRTQWLRDNGFDGIDWDQNTQQITQYVLSAISGAYITIALISQVIKIKKYKQKLDMKDSDKIDLPKFTYENSIKDNKIKGDFEQ